MSSRRTSSRLIVSSLTVLAFVVWMPTWFRNCTDYGKGLTRRGASSALDTAESAEGSAWRDHPARRSDAVDTLYRAAVRHDSRDEVRLPPNTEPGVVANRRLSQPVLRSTSEIAIAAKTGIELRLVADVGGEPEEERASAGGNPGCDARSGPLPPEANQSARQSQAMSHASGTCERPRGGRLVHAGPDMPRRPQRPASRSRRT